MNEICKPMALLLIKVFYKKYVLFIITDIILCSQLLYKIVQILKKCIFEEIDLFLESLLCCS
jgi:hypothetical protein